MNTGITVFCNVYCEKCYLNKIYLTMTSNTAKHKVASNYVLKFDLNRNAC